MLYLPTPGTSCRFCLFFNCAFVKCLLTPMVYLGPEVQSKGLYLPGPGTDVSL